MNVPPIKPDWMLIDGSSLIFRAFYGVPRTMKAPGGGLNNAMRGFLDVLARLLTERRPARVVVATDEDWRPQWRVELIPSYKTHRTAEPVPPELDPQISPTWEVLRAFGFAVVGAAGYEAEDIIASVAAQASGRIEIISGDRDLFALVRDPDICVIYPEGKGKWRRVDEAEIEARYQIPGRTYIDYAVLRGDPSDGLPGLPGVGDKSAAAMVRRHGSIDGVISGAKLSETNVDYLRRAISVVRPVDSIPLQLPPAEVPRHAVDPDQVNVLARQYGLGGSVDRLRAALPAG
jgi:5'-3' exonuclease